MQLVLALHTGAAVVHDHVVVDERRSTLLARIQVGRPRQSQTAGPASRPGRRRAGRTGADRSKRAGARLPRPSTSGRGRARRGPSPSCRRPDARAARHRRDVPQHRGLRAAHRRGLRRTDRRRRPGRRRTRRIAPCRPSRALGRPLAASDESGAQCRRRAAGADRRSADGVAGARPRRARTGPAALSPRRRRPRANRSVDARRGCSVGPRCSAA